MGDSKSTQTQQTASSATRSPWAPAVAGLTGAAGDASSLYGATNNTPVLASALTSGQDQLISNANAGVTSALAQQGTQGVSGLLQAGGQTATGQAGIAGIDSALNGFNANNATTAGYLTPYADGSNIGRNNADFTSALNTAMQKTADTVNSQFSGMGRYGSGADTDALATSLGNQATSAYAGQYNQDVADQMSAINALNSQATAGLSGNISGRTANAGIGQQSVANMMAGISAIPGLNASENLDANNLIGAGNQGWSNLDNYSSLMSAIGGMGGTSTGTGSGTTTNQNDPSTLGMILAGIGGIGNLGKSGIGSSIGSGFSIPGLGFLASAGA